ncbi:biotin--[acetyl-CoA-carboxylase] ligase [Microbacterium sp. cf332]|uniref:biotin--[acetyl-CoA-carboxylase] ligase n=1 Tax=Microbacterium sp. cf332 TaxID=1761804 RepID=UPI00088B8528|nr:biotin--[acetyl-CoA-carboxylase] ligase [Microbacterium sp. cf332]SDQ79111.1 BirA family transcriptional regulator, biotin operon repressor / biotin-[acetyl-CoA-carboxylase] ligase [Microbacterium sp. cf332]
MTIPENGYPRAAAVTPRLHLVAQTDSTNAHLRRDVEAEPDAHPHLSVVVTTDQREGRGRLDRSWTTPPGTALAVSVLLRVGAVPVRSRGWIPLVAGLAMSDAVSAQLRDSAVGVKWPNDVLVDGRKISGILAEVLPGADGDVILGAGVNTTMAEVDLPVSTATSFAAMGATVDEDRLLADFLGGVRDHIAHLAVSGADEGLRDRVAAACLTLGADVVVSLPGGESLTGRAERLDEDGRLVVGTGAAETAVGAGDVVHVRGIG